MIYPRLYLARNLLREDGVIFISIDDNEVNNLRKICDEVFGEENFIAELVWQKKTGAGAKSKGFIGLHEYVLCFAKLIIPTWDIAAPMSEKTKAMYTKKDEHFAKLGPFATWPLDTTSMDERTNLRFPIFHQGQEIWPRKQWLWSKSRVELAQQENKLTFNYNDKTASWSVRFKGYLFEENGEEKSGKPTSVMIGPYTQEGTKDFQKYFDRDVFPFPKPVALLKHLLSIQVEGVEVSGDDIVMDFFAGSGTTAEAILQLNQETDQNIKFILVQLPEPCSNDSEAFKAGYKTISDIGKERIRRVLESIDTATRKKLEIDKNKSPELFTADIEPSSEKLTMDLGFKVLKLNKSNFKQWQKLDPATPVEKIEEQLSLHIDHIDHQATPEDLLYEILLKTGFKPTEKIETRTIVGTKVFSVAEGALLLCLEDTVTKELIDQIAEIEPMQFICLDSAFHSNDQLKANAVQTFAARNMQKEKHNQIIFKTI